MPSKLEADAAGDALQYHDASFTRPMTDYRQLGYLLCRISIYYRREERFITTANVNDKGFNFNASNENTN